MVKMARVRVIVDGVEYEVEVEELGTGRFRVAFEGKEYTVEAKELGIDTSTLSMMARAATQSAPTARPTSTPQVASNSAPIPAVHEASTVAEGSVVVAPMPGKVLRVLVREGDRVEAGQGLLTLEAMKMENEIPAPKNGTIKKILIKKGDTVNTGDPLIEIEG